ncbi:hypothetical protein BRD06_06915 [Halobacteriales archaeon QS_9_67_15]|nr:MAG: hypothetical protein BRD06_06915 [Halobacteriales archaeon QS_9_67_15]
MGTRNAANFEEAGAEIAGGGALADIGVHALDFALYLFDFPKMTDVSGVTRTAFGDRDDYADPDGWCFHRDQTENTFDAKDSATALVRCENGATISPDVSWVTNRETNTGVTVRGTDAGASLALGGDTLSVNETEAGSRDHYADTEYEANDEVSGHRAEDELSLRVVTDGTAPGTNTVEDGLLVQRVLDATYRSAKQGSSVTL